jgi:hypothetical protein
VARVVQVLGSSSLCQTLLLLMLIDERLVLTPIANELHIILSLITIIQMRPTGEKIRRSRRRRISMMIGRGFRANLREDLGGERLSARQRNRVFLFAYAALLLM